MNRREDARIYIVCHRPVEYGIWDNALYQPLQVGFNDGFTELRDNTGENIAEWNEVFAENTGLYWLWKNRPAGLKTIGFCQYRRRLEFPEDFDFDGVFENYDIMAAMPIILLPNIAKQYERCHSVSDLQLIRKIIERDRPEYLKDFDDHIMNGNFLFYSNGFVMRSEVFDQYCSFLFGVLEAFRKEKGWDTPEIAKEKIDQEIAAGERKDIDGHNGKDGKGGNGYQHQVLAFLSERLLTLFIRHNFAPNKVRIQNYYKYEGI